MKYGFVTTLDDTFSNAVERVRSALQDEGFGVLTEIDVKATLKTKLGIDRPPYMILGACNPALAHQALEADPDIGLLLPCNVIVREEPDSTITVGFMDPEAVLSMVHKDAVATIASEVRSRLMRVKQTLNESASG